MKNRFFLFAFMISFLMFAQSTTTTFRSKVRFQNVSQNNNLTKFLAIEPTGGEVKWVDKSSFTSPTPGFQDVLNVSKNSYSLNGSPAFNILQGSNFSTNFRAESIIFNDNTPNSNRQTSISFDGFVSENNNGGKKVSLTTEDGLTLKTNLTGFTGKIKTNLLTVDRDWNIENRNGIIPIAMVSGLDNLGIGLNTLNVSNSGYNSAFGVQSMPLFTGSLSTSVGAYSMHTSTGGLANSAFGSQSLQNHTTGQRNTAIGSGSGYNLKTGSENTGLGYASMGGVSANMSGSRNICVGFQAGRDLTTGSNNILIENIVNASITTGSNNIVLNPVQRSGVSTGSNNVIIGGFDSTFQAGMSNTIILGTGNGTQRLTINETGLVRLVSGAPVYTGNATAIAGGLTVGSIYRTATGQLMIVY